MALNVADLRLVKNIFNFPTDAYTCTCRGLNFDVRLNAKIIQSMQPFYSTIFTLCLLFIPKHETYSK